MKRYVADGLAQFALHTSDIFHVCQQSDAILLLSPPLLEIIKESRLSSDYHHPSSSVKNATLFSPLLLVFLPSMEKRERFRVRLTNRRNLPRVRGSKRFFERSFFL